MLTSIDVKFIFDSACKLASLEDKGCSAPQINILQICCPSSCLLSVLAMVCYLPISSL